MPALPAAARRYLEELVTIGTYKWEYQTEFIRKYEHQGRAEGLAEGEVTAGSVDDLFA